MTTALDDLRSAAQASGLRVTAEARWPESADDDQVPPLPGFVVSAFSPLLAQVAARCLTRRPVLGAAATGVAGSVTAVIIISELGDVTSAVHVSGALDRGERVLPLLFFQSVPNAVVGYVAARWRLTGPVVCLDTAAAGLACADLLIEDGDADEALIIRVEVGAREHAEAIVVTRNGQGGRW